MTSGLDSIALAVAHLEEIGNKPTSQASNATSASVSREVTYVPSSSSSGPTAPAQTAAAAASVNPRHPSFIISTTSRVVSSESISSAAGRERSVPTAVAENDMVPAIKMLPQQQQQTGSIPKQKESVIVPVPAQDATKPASSGSNSNNLALILADPNSWLQATEHISKLPDPPAGTFDKILQEDVLCGRGGESNHHPGNQQYRRLVKAFQPLYIASKRRDKPRIAQCIVYTIRSYGGRFLKRTNGVSAEGVSPNTQLFEDVGNTKAREKTSQALREGAPELRGVSGSQEGGKEVPAQIPSNNSAQSSKQSSPLTVPSVPQSSVPTGLPANGFLNAQILQQLPYGAHPGAFHHHHHPYFAAQQHLTPLQQALLAAAAPPNAQPVVPAMVKHGFVDRKLPHLTPTGPTIENAKKRPMPHVVSSEDSNSTGSSEGSLSASVRGPRLKRLKHRLQQESSEEVPASPAVDTKA